MCCVRFEHQRYVECVASVLSISDMFNVLLPFSTSPVCFICCFRFGHQQCVLYVVFVFNDALMYSYFMDICRELNYIMLLSGNDMVDTFMTCYMLINIFYCMLKKTLHIMRRSG